MNIFIFIGFFRDYTQSFNINLSIKYNIVQFIMKIMYYQKDWKEI